MSFTELRKMWNEADKKAMDWRTAGEKELLSRMFDAYSRLKECGWRDIDYCPKDGTRFLAITAGSTGVHEHYYEGEWPDGKWWAVASGDLWPSMPVLWKPIPEGKQ